MNIHKDSFKYFTIYKTTNLINGKCYIGMHSTNNLHDSYIGSGVLLKKAICKYGIQNFEKEILFVFDNYEDMVAKEIELITVEVMESDMYYNLKTGGEGGIYHESIRHKISEKAKGRVVSKDVIERCLASRKKNGNWYKSGEEHHMFGKSLPKETLDSISKTLKEKHKNGHKVWNHGVSFKETMTEEERKKFGRNTTKENNPSFGSKWLGEETLGVKCYIKAGDLELEFKLREKGWVEKPKNFNSLKSVTKNIKEYL